MNSILIFFEAGIPGFYFMSRFHSHISSSIKIIESYTAIEPFAGHLKKYFAANKKYGSKDRKTIASLCYNYFRLGHALKNKTTEEKIFAGLFLTENKANALLEALKPALNDKIELTLPEKLVLLDINAGNIFPFVNALGEGLKDNSFYESFLQQPHLFLRLRPGKKSIVQSKLTNAAISFNVLKDECIELENATSLDDVIKINKEVVVQDASSQKVFNYLDTSPVISNKNKLTAWDCCAASGGKSILLHDKLKGNLQLTVSDIRENILVNCKKRLQEAGVNIYKSVITDLTKNTSQIGEDSFSIVICDAPCTGSGTWGRTPEQLLYYKQNNIQEYAKKQKLIAENALQHLTKDGLFFYITCSVFKKENEAVAEYLKEKFHLQLLQMEYIKGYEIKADTMFVAVFKK
ncbi:MAG: Fmu (Sun) domain-containing protein [Ferruginibacter sp.]